MRPLDNRESYEWIKAACGVHIYLLIILLFILFISLVKKALSALYGVYQIEYWHEFQRICDSLGNSCMDI